jgi:hypothetical protein
VLTLTTPVLGAATGTSLALGGATLGSNALAVTGTAAISGNTGIGTTSPSDILDVQKNQNATTNFYFRNTDTTSASSRAYFNVISGSVTATLKAINADHVYLDRTASTNLYFQCNNSAQMTLTSGGLLGIGMTPSNVLDITQNQNGGSTVKILNNSATANASAQFQMSNGTTNSYVAQFGSSGTGTGLNLADCMSIQTTCTNGMRFGVNASTPYIWYQGSSERGRIDGTSANLFWGSSSAQSGMDNSGGQIGVARGIFSSNGNGLQWGATSYIIGNANSTVTVISGGNGGVQLTPGATAWASASDETMKTDLIPIQSGAEKVASLRAMTGRYKTDEEGVSRSFLIAQDVQKVLPEAVTAGEDGTLGLRYTEVVPLLVAAIQELTTRLAALEAK